MPCTFFRTVCRDYKRKNLALLAKHRCVDLLNVDEDGLSEALDDYEAEFGSLNGLESCQENKF